MAIIAFSYSQFSGIRASILTDAVQMILMLIVGVGFAIFGVKNGGGMETLLAGLGGAAGDNKMLFSKKGIEIFLDFGLPATIGLISGPFGDQCFWQRVFCVRKDGINRAFFLGALLFCVVPLSMGIIGFIGAGVKFEVSDVGILNLELINMLFPKWVTIPFLFMIVSGLLSTIDSNLCAISSLTTDIYKKKTLEKTKFIMVLFLIVGIVIANIPGLTVTHLFLMYGTLRAATLFPTILTLQGMKLKSKYMVRGIITAWVIGLPIFAYGNIQGNAIYKTVGSILTVVLSGGIAMIMSQKEKLVK